VKRWLSVPGRAPYELSEGVDVTIGRGHDCDLSLYSTMLSREHACVRWQNGLPFLFDLESLNGTYLGPDRVHRHRLRDGDVFRLGDIWLRYNESADPPPPFESRLEADLPSPAEDEPDWDEFAQETRIYSRAEMLQEQVFAHDELTWLSRQVRHRGAALLHPSLGRGDVRSWLRDGAGGDEEVLWEFLRVGILAPRDHRRALRDLPVDDVAEACRLTRRGEKLRTVLSGKTVVWNEIASLRYQSRQGPLFKPLRMIARAYRPGGGLAELDLERLVYELGHIYAADLGPAELDDGLRRLQALGVLAPAAGGGREAWYPADWRDGAVEISARGRAMLEGFRLEEDA